jgi:hypothetical protein
MARKECKWPVERPLPEVFYAGRSLSMDDKNAALDSQSYDLRNTHLLKLPAYYNLDTILRAKWA